ncbi:unnamed protein product, partial [Ectocarpus sp. 12 AP-2014]
RLEAREAAARSFSEACLRRRAGQGVRGAGAAGLARVSGETRGQRASAAVQCLQDLPCAGGALAGRQAGGGDVKTAAPAARSAGSSPDGVAKVRVFSPPADRRRVRALAQDANREAAAEDLPHRPRSRCHRRGQRWHGRLYPELDRPSDADGAVLRYFP